MSITRRKHEVIEWYQECSKPVPQFVHDAQEGVIFASGLTFVGMSACHLPLHPVGVLRDDGQVEWLPESEQLEFCRKHYGPLNGAKVSIEPDEPGHLRTHLTDGQVGRIRAFKDQLGDVDALSLGDTLKNFQRDATPERELVVFERVASAFTALMESRSADMRHDVYKVLMAATFVGMSPVALVKSTHLGRPFVESVVSEVVSKGL